MEQKPIVSIICATHNRADLIGKAIESVLNQTHENWEMIIVADGCEDNTAKVVQSYKDSRIRFFDMPKFEYYTHVRNYGLQQATGELLCYRDDDGLWDKTFFEKMSRPFIAPDVILTYCGRKTFEGVKLSTIDVSQMRGLKPTYLNPMKNYMGKESLSNNVDVGDFMHRKSAFKADFQGFSTEKDRVGYCSDARLFDDIELYNPHCKIVMVPERLSYFFLKHGAKTENMTIRKLKSREKNQYTEEEAWQL